MCRRAQIRWSTLQSGSYDSGNTAFTVARRSLAAALKQAVVPEGALEAALQEDPARPDYLDSGFRLVLAVNKADLLPSVVTRTRLEVVLL